LEGPKYGTERKVLLVTRATYIAKFCS
jgi:hypothetical protein